MSKEADKRKMESVAFAEALAALGGATAVHIDYPQESTWHQCNSADVAEGYARSMETWDGEGWKQVDTIRFLQMDVGGTVIVWLSHEDHEWAAAEKRSQEG
jgi:hypothetical protein